MSGRSEASAKDELLLEDGQPRFDTSVPFDFSLKVEVPSVRATDPSTPLPPSLQSLLESVDADAAIDDDPWEEFEASARPRRRKHRFLWF